MDADIQTGQLRDQDTQSGEVLGRQLVHHEPHGVWRRLDVAVDKAADEGERLTPVCTTTDAHNQLRLRASTAHHPVDRGRNSHRHRRRCSRVGAGTQGRGRGWQLSWR